MGKKVTWSKNTVAKSKYNKLSDHGTLEHPAFAEVREAYKNDDLRMDRDWALDFRLHTASKIAKKRQGDIHWSGVKNFELEQLGLIAQFCTQLKTELDA